MEKIDCLDHGFVRLVDTMGDDSSIVQAARVSYGEGTQSVSKDETLIRYLMRNRHMTPFEMVQLKFHIKAPIFVVRQWHRHRTWSYNEVSARYSILPEEYYVPKEEHITLQSKTNKQGKTGDTVPWQENYMQGPGETSSSWSESLDFAQALSHSYYDTYIKNNMTREIARIALPFGQYTEMYAAVNLRNLFHFLSLRWDSHAQYEIREYASALYKLVQPIVPVACKAFEDYVQNSLSFSGREVEALQDFLSVFIDETNVEDFIKATKMNVSGRFKNKRERVEFEKKLDKLLENALNGVWING